MNTSILFFILNPFLGFVNAFQNYKQTWAKNAVWLFVIFYGFTMKKAEFSDSSRYVQKLEILHKHDQNLSVFFASLYQVNEIGSGYVDIYEPFITFITAIYTENGDVLYALFGIVFGFFYSRNIWFLFELISENKLDKLLWLILISFVCVVGFWTLGGVRMWTAAHVFFYGCSIYFSKQLKTGLILAASAVLVHFSFLFPVALLFVYLFFKPTHRILFYFFLATFFISSLNIQFVAKLIQNYTPEAFMTRAINYTNEDYAETISEINSTANWYTVNLNKVLLWAITGIYCVFQFKTKNIKRLSPLGNKFYGFSLLLLTAANLLTDLPSGIRYMVLAQLYALAAILIILFGNSISSLKNNIYFTIPFFIFFNIVSIRNAFETLTIDGVLSNPIFTLFAKTGIPIIDLIK